MHTDPDDGLLVRVPDGWELGREFEPRIACLTIGTESGGIDIALPKPHDFRVFHKPIDLDGHLAYEFAFWLEVWISLDQVTFGALLDEEVLKFFKVVLVAADGSEVRIAEDLYAELVTPEVAVMEADPRTN